MFKQPKLGNNFSICLFSDKVTFLTVTLQDLTPINFIWLILISGVEQAKLYLIVCGRMNRQLIYDNIMISVKTRYMAEGLNGYNRLFGHLRLAEGI